IYRTNKIINFAYGAMGGVGGILSVMLYKQSHWNYFLAMGVGLLASFALGAIVEITRIRRFANSTRLILTVATIGLAQVLGGFQLYINQWFHSSGLIGGFDTPFNFRFTVKPVIFNGNHI